MCCFLTKLYCIVMEIVCTETQLETDVINVNELHLFENIEIVKGKRGILLESFL